MKKIIAFIILCISVCLMLVGCGKPADVQLGLQLTSQMEELVKSDDYFELLRMSPNLNSTRKDFIADDYDTPTNVYSISVPDSYTILNKMRNIDKTVWNALSDTVKEQLLYRATMPVLLNNINNASGSRDYISFISVYTITKQFDNCSIKEDITYLYIFETGKPIAVTFTANNNTVTAIAHFMILPSTELSDIKELFSPYGCTVDVVR